MALRITRAVGSKLYGGYSLDPDDLDGTFDHCIWVRRVINNHDEKRVVVNLVTEKGTEELSLAMGETHWFLDNVGLKFTGVQEHWAEQQPYCEACGNGDKQAKRMIPQARFGIDAPKEYTILRHDIRTK